MVGVNLTGRSVVAELQGYYQSQTNQRWLEVLVDCPGTQEVYTYKLPAQLTVQPGDILSVPFGANQVGAIALRFVEHPPVDLSPDKIRAVEDVVSRGFFPPAYWELLNRVAAYYYTPLIAAIRVALPPGLLGRSQRRIKLIGEIKPGVDAFCTPAAKEILALLQAQPNKDYSFIYLQRQVRNAYRGVRELLRLSLVESYLEPPRLTRPKLQKAVTLVGTGLERDITSRQQEILDVLRRQGGDIWLSELLRLCNASPSTLKTLEQKGYVVIEEREMLRQEQGVLQAADEPKTLTAAQSRAVETITQLAGCDRVLLHGVTGSGKTEVYLQAIAPILRQGKSALVLVPEIGLTPQLTDRFRARFGSKVCVYHSALSDGERYDTWRQMLLGEPQVVIGTRSAIFAPLPRLGLIILDEEHDSSFKQDSPIPTYHARTVAQWRAELENCPLVLGSATPSLESWVISREQGSRGAEEQQQTTTNYQLPTTHYLSLPERIQSRPLPPVEVVDMRQEIQEGNRSIFSRALLEALQQLQARGQQGILFIHRRGHSTFVSCRSCGNVLECPACDVSLSYHHTEEGAPQLLRCHYCNYSQSHPRNCPECGSPYLKFFGSGTQRVAQEITRLFPQLRFIRFDSDTTRTKGAHRTLLTQFANREADLLIGTQMLTKGLDLPQVTLIGVVAADGLLHLPDYRAAERAFQTLTQVAGRAGRGDDPGRVILQTYTPDHPVIQAVRQHEYEGFVEAELQQRVALNYPPHGRLILLRLSSVEASAVENTAGAIASYLNNYITPSWEILGPAPANILRVANRYRWQILLKIATDLQPVLPDWQQVRSLCPNNVSLTIDVDPLNLM
ncbi:primosomal protein N' [Chroococcidiopsis thermalis]|jgi:primosomal protein N' (replication factor Y) (superfamily II helicase)|uniref:Replication restart protein PriA n=1 Tax=Chroococcidiopsis thermalis (strain PCC 7203) TaxID=251229 RepID=K9U170_CHRTP|nr:replication restart DNA helicase PriA [Chroococcidiopsis thermalis PCC 7203]